MKFDIDLFAVRRRLSPICFNRKAQFTLETGSGIRVWCPAALHEAQEPCTG